MIRDISKWRRINTLLDAGLALPPAQRGAFLAGLSGEHADILPLLRPLLDRATVESDVFMERPVHSLWAEAIGNETGPQRGDRVGPYHLLRELGSGGMGTVWLAERADGMLQRQIALKLPRYGWGPGVAERLEQERDALAALEHRHIARLYDAGSTGEGRPYIALEYVEGVPIDVFAAEHSLSVRARVELFRQVTEAVDFAHRRLIVHRDLKPSNILVTGDGEVRLLDFGAAKLLYDGGAQPSSLTREVGRAMSPDYASPEQIRGDQITVGSDVYSLGVVLFELLTGQRPYRLERRSSAALEAAIAEADVPMPSAVVANDRRLRRELRGDLDNILRKALKKSTDERYATVRELDADLQRWLKHEPVTARGDSLSYRVTRFVRRHRVAVAMSAIVIFAVISATAVATMEMFEARRQRDEARAQQKRAEAQERFANMVMEQTGPGGRPLTLEEMLDRSVQLLEQQYRDDPAFIARSLIPISGRYMNLGNTAKELAALQKAEAIARRIGDSLLLLSVQCNTVETDLVQGNFERAEQRMREARSLQARTLRLPDSARIDCIHAEATLADARGDSATAVERINQALSWQERLDRTDQTYRSLLSHAQMLYMHAGRPQDAYAVADRTLAVLKDTDAENDEARSAALHNQAVALSQMGEIANAEIREKEALTLVGDRDPSHADQPVLSNVYGRLLTRLNRAREGAPWMQRSLELARGGGNREAQIFALAALAEAQSSMGHTMQALTAVRAALALLDEQSSPRMRVVVSHARAVAALGRADLSQARNAVASLLIDMGYPDAQKLRAFPSADLQLLLAARVALAGGHAAEAAHFSEQALAIGSAVARDPRRSATVGEARLLLAKARDALHDADAAREAIRDGEVALSAGLGPEHPLTLEAAALTRRLQSLPMSGSRPDSR
jgi:serine/threonine protein kinase/tetratricopeptide (TPR) repeat protein